MPLPRFADLYGASCWLLNRAIEHAVKCIASAWQFQQATFERFSESVVERPEIAVVELGMIRRAPLLQDLRHHRCRDGPGIQRSNNQVVRLGVAHLAIAV